MNVEGKLYSKSETKKISEKLSKREFVIEYAENPMYPEYIKFELINDKTQQIDGFDLGARLQVEFNLKGRRWTNPEGEEIIFNSLQAWRIKEGNADPNMREVQPENAAAFKMSDIQDNQGDDLPF